MDFVFFIPVWIAFLTDFLGIIKTWPSVIDITLLFYKKK